jgi:hypothetical protein
MLLNKHLINPTWGVLFEGDTGGSGGTGNGGTDPRDGGTGDDANTGGDGGGTGDDKKFSQADLDRIVGDRAKRAGEAAIAKLLQDLGVEKPEELKARIEAQRKAEDEKKSELEKLQDAQRKAEEKAAQSEKERDEARTERDGILIRHAIELKAVELGFANARDAYELLLSDESLAEVEISEAGKVSGFEKALEELAKSGRLPVKASPGAGLGTPPRKSSPGAQTQTKEEPVPVPAIRF